VFESARDRDPSPEAFEGLSWAAWWLDDADAVFEARERAFHGYRDDGDAASAARMATWLAASGRTGSRAHGSALRTRCTTLYVQSPPGVVVLRDFAHRAVREATT
jgi:hypothetical protein